VGGGLSGLALPFSSTARAGPKRCLILENHAIFGGEARAQ
jgi:hypothetical protein